MLRVILFLLATVNCEENNKLTILHTNDIHSHYDIANKYGTDCKPDQVAKKICWGGLARLKRAIDIERQRHPNHLLLDAGDHFQGTRFYKYYKGNITAPAMNVIGYDAMTLGNHEFDGGPQALADAISPVKFPIVVSNIDATSVPDLNAKIEPYFLFPNHQVAIVGYLTPTAPDITETKTVKVLNPIEPVQRAIDKVRELGYKRIIGLSHHGYKEDMDLASKTRGLSLIVGGHSHSYLKPTESSSGSLGEGLKYDGLYPTPVTNLDKKQTYVVQAGCWGRFLGHIDIEFGNDGYLIDIKGAPIELTLALKEDETMKNMVQQWRVPFDVTGLVEIGETDVEFEKNGCETECDLGNLVTDVLLSYRKQSDVSFFVFGGLRSGISPGKINVGDIQDMLPFDDPVVEFELTGQRVWDIIEAAVSKSNNFNNKPVTTSIFVAGLKFSYNPNSLIYNRVINVETKSSTGWVPLDLKKNYKVSTTEYIAKGGDNIINPAITDFPKFNNSDVVVIDYIKSHSPVMRPSGGRMIIVN